MARRSDLVLRLARRGGRERSSDGSDRTQHGRFDGFPVCIDWDRGGTLLVVDGAGRRVVVPGSSGGADDRVVADLALLSDAPWNEIVSHSSGRCYVNGIGFDMLAGDAPSTGQIAVIDTDGSARLVASDLAFPNGMVITADGSRLVVAESHAGRLTSFAVADNGDLVDRSIFAEITGSAPDGLCLGDNDTIWYADVPNQHCRRIAPGGAVVETIGVDRGCFSCAPAPDGGLYITANVWDEHTFATGTPRRGVLYHAVPVPASKR